MSTEVHVLADRRSALAFWFGCLIVTAGVVLHVPMFLMGRSSHYHLAGMPMDRGMLLGMAAIVVGIALAAYGLLPRIVRGVDHSVETLVPRKMRR